MMGDLLDKVPDWVMAIVAGLMFMYYVQIIVGLILMGDHFHYPRVKINNKIDEWTPIVWCPLRLYYVWIFTDKLTYKE